MSTIKHLREDDPPQANPFDALVELNQIQESINSFALHNKGLFQNRIRFSRQVGIIHTNINLLKKRILKDQKLKSEAPGKKIPRAI